MPGGLEGAAHGQREPPGDGMRRFNRDLRSSTLDDLGLLPTLEGLAASLTEKDGIEFIRLGAAARPPLPAALPELAHRDTGTRRNHDQTLCLCVLV